MRTEWVTRRRDDRTKTQMHYARKGIVTEEMAYVAARERVDPTRVRDEVARGRLVIPANVMHVNLEPMGIGIALACKVNANIGNSAVTSEIEGELVAASTAETPAAFSLGQRVFHQKFGYGRISEIDGNKLTVEFEKAGQKKVVASFVEAV